jgi:hypothetical protein
MKLKEKFNYEEKHFLMLDAEKCEKIADDYAIEFAEWLLKFDNLKNEKEYVIKQLLETFKKEKGL